MSVEIPFTTADAFTSRPFTGNPAAVIIWPDNHFADDEGLAHNIAAEFNLPVTAFCHILAGHSEEEPKYAVRWRTPTTELPLCGHATLATAHSLFTSLHPSANLITFESRKSGTLTAHREADGGGVSLDFPVAQLMTLEDGHRRRPKILEAVTRAVKGLQASTVLRVGWWDNHQTPIVELAAGTDLEHLEVEPELLADLGESVILTCPAPAESGYDIYSRVFCPAIGIPEDAVTGSAHTALAPFWLSDENSFSRLPDSTKMRSHPKRLRAKQVSKRGGEMDVELDEANRRVRLIGRARVVTWGVLEL